jgi:hypothetical protein
MFLKLSNAISNFTKMTSLKLLSDFYTAYTLTSMSLGYVINFFFERGRTQKGPDAALTESDGVTFYKEDLQIKGK